MIALLVILSKRLTIEVSSMIEWVSSWEVGGITEASDRQAEKDDGKQPLNIRKS